MRGMDRLRKAIIDDVTEDIGMIGELTEWHEELLKAWNAVCTMSPTVGIPAPITENDIEGAFDGSGADWEPPIDHTED